ncbi:hypothetical protein D0T84_20635 [Dysgonomonas sp. 521]|uniref:hypothetical protein n=1 Tax=Dysgonomonas sp. 521 TaxID=2302932 RepID=UPI0013D15F37|nr:hypothetical protein [Dysgonomonas sp. 521]NDV97289.1 hypothetical protein [Dysgonomonas sp. 521]
MKPYKIFFLSTLLTTTMSLRGQITIGSNLPSTRVALLDLKASQAKDNVLLSSASDENNVTVREGDGGLLLPRVKLMSVNTLEPFIPANDSEFKDNINNLKERLAGLVVYNLTNNGSGAALYPGVYTWNGKKWETTFANEAAAIIKEHPKPFTFCQTGNEEAEKGELEFTFEVDGLGDWTYQWYQVVGRNRHIRVGAPIGNSEEGSTVTAIDDTDKEKTFRPYPLDILKGPTSDANNAGFYQFYCVAKSSLGEELTSNIAEVAVGCGAKNSKGEWISFMCFNLGAGAGIGTASYNGITIQGQKGYTIGAFANAANGTHSYITDEEVVWGDLFQWGRIADGQEKRKSNTELYSGVLIANISDGSLCPDKSIPSPWQQVKSGTPGYGEFIIGNPTWNPIGNSKQIQLWRTGRFVQNDPCAHFLKDNGSYQDFWYNDAEPASKSVCEDTNTSWRLPSQDEWASIYRGGTVSGASGNALANNWDWYDGTATNYSRGYEIKPDGITTTLFLPANGFRHHVNGSLRNQSTEGYYWSVSAFSEDRAYILFFDENKVAPANSATRASGSAIRCVKSD